jgi:hypothetical protein
MASSDHMLPVDERTAASALSNTNVSLKREENNDKA